MTDFCNQQWDKVCIFILMVELLQQHALILLLFFTIATLYSSVGFGGGSSYLAVLALSGLAYSEIRSTALLCNIVVVSSNVFAFVKSRQYEWKKITPLVLLSVPMAFLGGYLTLGKQIFYIVLGGTLFFAAISMWLSKRFVRAGQEPKRNAVLGNSLIGGAIGFLSGLVGIGGGIFLAPALHLSFWSTPQKIAAAASLFIWVNSISGLAGQVSNKQFALDWTLTVSLLIVVFLGSLLGNRLRKASFSPIVLKKATAVLIALVSLRILIPYLF